MLTPWLDSAIEGTDTARAGARADITIHAPTAAAASDVNVNRLPFSAGACVSSAVRRQVRHRGSLAGPIASLRFRLTIVESPLEPTPRSWADDAVRHASPCLATRAPGHLGERSRSAGNLL